MKTKRYFGVVVGILLILGLAFFVWSRLANALTKVDPSPRDPVPRTPRSGLQVRTSDHLAESGILDLPEAGKIVYAKHRVIRVAELIKRLNDDNVYRQFMNTSPNVTIDAYEDNKGNLVFMEHNRGHYRSKGRDAEAIQMIKNSGVIIGESVNSKFRLDDDEFVKSLLNEFLNRGYLTSEASSQYPEHIVEFTLWPVSVKFSDSYKGKEPKGVEFQSIMIRKSAGIPNDYLYDEPYRPDQLYLRRWQVHYYQKGNSTQEGNLTGCAAQALVEPRLDLPAVESGSNK